MSTTGKPNILLIIADDLGADTVLVTDRSPVRSMYVMTDAGGPRILGELPHLSTLLHSGLYFGQAWAQPVCSPTRASLYCGIWPWRNGVGYPTAPELDPALVTSLPDLLVGEGYESGLFGKWHLGDTTPYLPAPDHGWNLHVGTLAGVITAPTGSGNDYMNWDKYTSADGYAPPATPTATYATQDTVNEAGAWIGGLLSTTPWFATIAFHTPHSPFHTPPAGFQLPAGAAPVTDDDEFNAMAQNMDYNIGRLLGSGAGPAIDSIAQDQLENTVIIFLGDNGSPPDTALEEPKATIYEGGVRVPMIVADGTVVGAELAGTTATPRFLHANKLNRTSPRLVHAVDLYETITEVAGVTAALPSPMDSVSLWRFASRPGPRPRTRDFNFSQYFRGNEQAVTIRNESHKLNCVRTDSGGVVTWAWSLYAYWRSEVPGLEDGSATDVYATALSDLTAGISNDDSDNLQALINELTLTGNYSIDDTGTAWVWP